MLVDKSLTPPFVGPIGAPFVGLGDDSELALITRRTYWMPLEEIFPFVDGISYAALQQEEATIVFDQSWSNLAYRFKEI